MNVCCQRMVFVVLIGAFGLSARAWAQAEAEPNNTATTANVLAGDPSLAAVTVTGSISIGTDVDWFRITTTQLASLHVQTYGASSSTCTLDTVVDLYASDGSTLLASNDQNGLNDCSLIHPDTQPGAAYLAAGIYLVRVTSYNSATGAYTLRVSPRLPQTYSEDVFTYQGVVRNGSAPITGTVDLRFSLWDHATTPSPGNQIGLTIDQPGVSVAGGLVNAQLNFGLSVFDATRRWLQIEVRSPAGTGTYVTLPRQELTRAPMAVHARFAQNAQYASVANSAGTAGNANYVPWTGLTGAPAVNTGGGPLRLTSGADASLAGGGSIVIGAQSGSNLVMDENEITARVNGTAGTLSLQHDGGVVQIGVATAATLIVNGFANKSGGGSWGTYSDARLKQGVEPLSGTLDKLLSVRGVSFEYTDPTAIGELPGRHTGMIAQEVEKVFPEWVHTRPDEYKMVAFTGFEALTVEALRDLRAEKDRQIADLEAKKDAQIADLRARLERLEAIVARGGGK